MHTVIILRRALGLIGLTLLLVQGMGCNKLYAQYNIKSATKKVTESKEKNAEKLMSAQYIDAQKAINTAQDDINRQDFKQAVVNSKTALAQSKSLLTQVTELRATELRQEAEYWLTKADLNQAQAINAEKLTQYKQDNDRGYKYYSKQSFNKAIAIYKQVRDNVNFLLKPLADDAKAGEKETVKMRDELVEEGAPTYAPKFVEEMNDLIAKIKKFNDEEKNYREALRHRDLAIQKKAEGIMKTREAKSKEQLAAIENQLDIATGLGAGLYAIQNYSICSKDYKSLLSEFFGKNYVLVLKQAPGLKVKVDELIEETKREAATAKAKEVENGVNTLVDAKARTYLPGRVEQLEVLLSKALQEFKDKKYEESKKISERGLELYQTILGDFNSLAEQEIKKAADVLGTGENVYRQMQNIFDHKIIGVIAPEDQRLEDAKQAMKEELRVRLQNARLSLEMAGVKRQDKDFDLAIEVAKRVAQSAQDVEQQTYRVVAHNAILEIANKLTLMEREGGRQYAAAETDKTLKLVEETKGLLHGGKYRDAVSKAGDSKAQLDILAQELERQAVKKIASASDALSMAKSSRAESYQNDTFNQAITSLDLAKNAGEGGATYQAILKAKEAEALAKEATEKALKQWTEEEIKRSDLLLEKARVAGASQYAAERMQKANDLRANLETLYKQGSFKQAIEVGEQTVEAADAAFYAKVNEAENEIATAKRFDGWTQEPKALADAMVAARNAREMMDKGRYDLGLQHAQAAAVQAKTVAKKAKRKAFESHMASLQKHIETAQNEGAGLYQSKDLSKILTDMNRLRNEYDETSYEDLAQGVEKLESQIAGVMEMTPDVLKNLVETMQARMVDLEKRRAKALMPDKVEAVELKIKYALIDFKAEKYRSSFQNTRDASRLLDEITNNLAERAFDRDLNDQLTAFSKQLEKFSPLLNVGSPALIQMASGAAGRMHAVALMNAASPSDLLTNIGEIDARIRELQAPPTRRDVKAATLKMLELARTSAHNFEKFTILDQYNTSDAREIIEIAFLQMRQARTQQQDVQRALRYAKSEIQTPRGVERVVSHHED